MGLLALATAGVASAPLLTAHGADKKKDEAADSIVISGASGRLAGEAIDALVDRGVPMDRLILVTRTPENLASFAERGAEVRTGDLNEPESLPDAFAGGRQLLLIGADGGDRVAQHRAAISAARRAGIRHIVYSSWINATEDNPAAVTRDHRLTEEALRNSGVGYTILRNQLYADGLVDLGARAVAAGQIVSNAGRGMWAPVTRRDCAAGVAVVLTTPGHEGKVYEFTGPDLISERDFARMLTAVTDEPVRVIDVSDATYVATLVQSGVPEAAAKVAASIGVATRQNYLNIKSETLEILLGRKPESVRELLATNRARLLAPAASAAR